MTLIRMNFSKTLSFLSEKFREGMPVGAGALCLIQIFSTLSFSVLYSTLILYATKGLHLSDTLATSITGSFIALNYFLHLLGGYIGGRFLSYRSLFGIGMLLQILGCALISVPDTSYLLWGIAVFLGGSGLNVTCINCMVTQLFKPNDKRRESAFLWNYSGMNIGFFVGFIMGGYFHQHSSYQTLFLLSGLGNLIALALTFYNWKILQDRDSAFVDLSTPQKKQTRIWGIAAIIALVLSLRVLMQYTNFCNQLIMVIGAAMLVLLVVLAVKQEPVDRNKMFAFILLALSSLIFWALYQLAPMGLQLFSERNVDRNVFGFIIQPQWIQNINTIVIIVGGPLMSFVFSHLRGKGINISIPFQFSLALLLIGAGFAILPIGISLADAQGYSNFIWIFLSYVLQSLGELFISPIGYAMVGQLAPLRLRGLMMGMWMMVTGIAAIFSDLFSKMALTSAGSADPLISNASYSHIFGMLGWSSIAAGVFLFVLIPIINRLTQEKKVEEFRTVLELKEAEMR